MSHFVLYFMSETHHLVLAGIVSLKLSVQCRVCLVPEHGRSHQFGSGSVDLKGAR